jgi:hypothetical protein
MHAHESPQAEALEHRPDVRSSEVVLRNHDYSRPYVVCLELTGDGRNAPETTGRYRLAPGEIRCLSTNTSSERTRVTAQLETGAGDTTVGRLNERPEHTAVIQLGNGVVCATHGV